MIKNIYIWNTALHGTPTSLSDAWQIIETLKTKSRNDYLGLNISDADKDDIDQEVDFFCMDALSSIEVADSHPLSTAKRDIYKILNDANWQPLYTIPLLFGELNNTINATLLTNQLDAEYTVAVFSELIGVCVLPNGKFYPVKKYDDGTVIDNWLDLVAYEKTQSIPKDKDVINLFQKQYKSTLLSFGWQLEKEVILDEAEYSFGNSNCFLLYIQPKGYGNYEFKIFCASQSLRYYYGLDLQFLEPWLNQEERQVGISLLTEDTTQFKITHINQVNSLLETICQKILPLSIPNTYIEMFSQVLKTRGASGEFYDKPLLSIALSYLVNDPNYTWYVKKLDNLFEIREDKKKFDSSGHPGILWTLDAKIEKINNFVNNLPPKLIDSSKGLASPEAAFQDMNVEGFSQKILPLLSQLLIGKGFTQQDSEDKPIFSRKVEYGEQRLSLAIGGGEGEFIISGQIAIETSILYPYYEQLGITYRINKPLINETLSSFFIDLPYFVNSNDSFLQYLTFFNDIVLTQLDAVSTLQGLDNLFDNGCPLDPYSGLPLTAVTQRNLMKNHVDIASQLLIAKLVGKRNMNEYIRRLNNSGYRNQYSQASNYVYDNINPSYQKDENKDLVQRILNLEI